MNNLRGIYLKEWRVWYNAFNKARELEVYIHPEWLDFRVWLDEIGPRQCESDQFCRDDWTKGWTPDNAGWRSMPFGRKRDYSYTESRMQTILSSIEPNRRRG
jgi:hypothetical protein